jgi:AraC family transcriptional activator of pobA
VTRNGVIPKYFLYGEAQREVDPDFLHVESIAARSRLHDWTIRPHVHRALHHFVLVSSGGGELQAEIDTQIFAAPTLIVVPAAFVHGFAFTPETDGWVITASESLLLRLAAYDVELAPALDLTCCITLNRSLVRHLALSGLFRTLVREYRGGAPGRRAAIEAVIKGILVVVLRLSYENTPAAELARGADSHLVARYCTLLEEHFKEPMSVADYATRLGVSLKRLRIVCARVTSASPSRLLADRRLVEAKRGLIYTTMNVAQIAYSCGFEDPAYFSRFFTRFTGEAPTEFRGDRVSERHPTPHSHARSRLV